MVASLRKKQKQALRKSQQALNEKKKMKKQRFAIIAFFVTLVVSLLTSCYHEKDRQGESAGV